jgi:hypothetical protein
MINNKFIIISSNILSNPELSDVDKLTWGILSSLCNDKGYCWASNAYIANALGKSTRTIIRSIQKLRQMNIIKYQIKKTDMNEDKRYIWVDFNLNTPEMSPPKEKNERKTSIGSDTSVTRDKNVMGGGDTSVMGGGDKNVTLIDNIYNNKNNTLTSITKKTPTPEYFNFSSMVGFEEIDQIRITSDQYNKLTSTHGIQAVHAVLLDFDAYLTNNPRKYKNHYKALGAWLRRDNNKATTNTSSGGKKYMSNTEHNRAVLAELNGEYTPPVGVFG